MRRIGHGRRRPRVGVRLLGGLVIATGLVATAGPLAAGERLRVPVTDEDGQPVTTGMVLFCPEAAPCHEYPLQADGSVVIDREVLEPGVAYAVLVYAEDLSVRYATDGWVYGGDDAPPVDAAPGLRGRPARQLEVVLPVPPPARSQPAAATSEPERRGPSFPRLLGGLMVPFMLGGHFGADHDALSGVSDVSPGFGAVLCYRYGYPVRRTLGRTTVSFQELSLSYAQHRYHVEPVQPADAGSDLTFHRVQLAWALGRLWERSQGTLGVAAGYGGVYDGSELLEYRDRRYGMFGLGLQGRYVLRVLGGEDRLSLGLMGQADLSYYFADHGDDDHWYGWAPSIAAGVMVF